ncbi:MAG TPA: hypothetical protein VIJ28_23355, partial [Chloroflexota bacterium]
MREHAALAAPVVQFTVTGPPNATAGATYFVTVIASDSSYVGTVQFSSSDPQAVLPAPYTFVLADTGFHTFS